VFLTLDDATGPVDATFFEDAQGPYAGTVFHSWLLVVRGVLRRTGPRGVSLRATGAWELPALWDAWTSGGLDAVRSVMAAEGPGFEIAEAVPGAAESRSSRPVMSRLPATEFHQGIAVTPQHESEHAAAAAAASGLPTGDRAGGMGGDLTHLRRVLVHVSGFRQSPYADIKPAGDDTRDARRMLGPGTAPDGDRQKDRSRREPPRKLWHASPGSSGR
jgi:error-prone DNA polymerase